jgi:predicted DNA-binding mobile mystery protein A
MRERERKLARKRLDVEMRPYRQAGREKNPTNGLLRAVRQALRIPVPEIAAKMGVNRSVVFDLEAREPKNTITLKSMSRMAEAMGCMMVYGIVPVGGKTLDELAEERLWASLLGVGSEIRGQGSGVTDLNSLQKIAWFSDTLRADTPNETRGEGGRGSS